MSAKSFKRFVKTLPYLNDLFQERDRLRLELAEANAARESLSIERAALDAERRTLLDGRASLDAAVRALERALSALEVQLADSKAERMALAERHSALEAKHSTLEERHAALEETYSALAEKHSELEKRRSVLEAEKVRLEAERRAAEAEAARLRTWVPPGHFYSPVPDVDEILLNEHNIWRKPLPRREIPGIDLREEAQLGLFREFLAYYHEQPFAAHKQEHLRYYFENENYSYSDAIFLYCMLRHLRPRRFIEVGSGFSSCVTLDTDELFLDRTLSCTFIDPHPELLLSMITEEDKPRIEIIGKKIQDVELGLFSELGRGDVLFIDSTHVAKTLSDVNHIFFEVLPRLNAGVFIHLHDIFYPFVYPKDWEMEKRAWNEAYLLRAFLQYNDSFEVYFCNTFLEYFHDAEFKKEMPLCMKNTGGSIWIRKIR